MEDKRIEDIKNAMYKIACSVGHGDRVEAAKAYAMLCIAENGQTTITTIELGECDAR
jgi:hypothetical protein